MIPLRCYLEVILNVMENRKLNILIKRKYQIKMNHHEDLNYNHSLLVHSLCQSQQNCSKASFQKKQTLGLLNELNMTYSRLTMDNKYDCLKEIQIRQSEVEQRFQHNPTKKQLYNIEVERCTNCKKIQKQLNSVYIFLEQMENKMIEKELLLAKSFKQITLQLAEKTKQAEKYQKKHIYTLEQLNSLKVNKNLLKLDLHQSSANDEKLRNQFYQTGKQYLSTMQSTLGSQSRRLNKFLKKNDHCPISSIPYDQSNFIDDIKQNNSSKLFVNSNSSSILFEFSSSDTQEQNSQIVESYGFNSIDTNRKTSSRQRFSKNMDKRTIPNQKDFEMSKLKFENNNLKSYNSVLLENVKPKTLASKVFNMY